MSGVQGHLPSLPLASYTNRAYRLRVVTSCVICRNCNPPNYYLAALVSKRCLQQTVSDTSSEPSLRTSPYALDNSPMMLRDG